MAPAPMVAASAMAVVAGRDQPDIEEGRRKSRQGLDTDFGEVGVALHRHQRAGGHRQEPDDRDRSADHHQSACTQTHLRDDPHQFDPVVGEHVADAAQRPAVELRLHADLIPGAGPAVDPLRQTREPPVDRPAAPLDRLGAHIVTRTATAVATTLIANNAMKVNTTVSFTALPTPAGPPPTEMPL